MPAVLALDAGTTSSRALVFAEDGRILAVAQREFRQFYPRPGWVEHDAEEIWETQIAVAADAIEKAGVAIGAIGITNQRETTVLWDRASSKPVANAIVWQDRRTSDMCDALRAEGQEELIRARTGLVIDAYFSGTKLRWLLDRTEIDPARLAFGTIDSWLVWNLTGGMAHVTDVTNASRTMLFDIRRAAWDDELLSILGIPRSVLPEVRSSSGMFAKTAAGLAIPAGIPILGIAGDQQAALFGQRCTQAGLAKNTYGTGSFVVMNSGAKPVSSSHGLLATIAWRIGNEPVQYALEGSIFVTGAAVQWLRDQLHIIKSASEIEELAASVPDTGGVVVVPAFTGLGTPHWDPHARGTILGLTRGSTAAHLARATLESIALQTADVLQAMQEDSGITLAELRVDGGGSTNDLLMQMQADLAGIPVVRTRNHEVTALGAAYLAGLPAPDAQSTPARIFEPAMSSEQREGRISTWRLAVDRAKGWASLALVLIVTAACTRGPVQPTWPYPMQFKEVTVDVFAGMSTQGRPVNFTAEQLSGRILWNLWSGDNATFWNYMVQHGLGTSDLLKVVTWNRAERFEKFGIINQPGFARPSKPDEFGLFIDAARDARYDIDKHIDRDTYGRSSGVMGLRLFRNPKFDPVKWDVKRFYADEDYYDDPKLERPYLVGMSCSFCHVGPDPVNPPANVDEPEYANLSDYVGQHYLKVAEVFGLTLDDDNFIKQLLMSNPPGTLDTSFIATDYLNNPGTMNGIYEIGGRLSVATAERVEGGALDLRNREPVTPRVLKDGADSAGVHAALSRVHVNIGTYWEEWIRHFRPLIGIREQTPFRVEDAQRKSPHWNWSESHSPALAAYFAFIAKPHKLAEAPGGEKWIDRSRLQRGQQVFAENCAGCHSSKLREESLQPDFLEGNFLGSEQRYPVTKIKTNAARAVARNALRGHVWDNFSSETYKTLPSVGSITVHDPFTRTDKQWTVPGGGRGYYRPPSLISVWASAPFFHHNTLGKHVHAVDVDSRMAAFNDAIEKLLWPAKREGIIWRTTKESSLKIPAVQLESRILRWLLRDRLRNNAYFLGPIPKGTPVNLLANADLEITSLAKARELAAVLKKERPVAELMALSACPDFIEDRGHYFGTELPDEDKRALIEFMKTF